METNFHTVTVTSVGQFLDLYTGKTVPYRTGTERFLVIRKRFYNLVSATSSHSRIIIIDLGWGTVIYRISWFSFLLLYLQMHYSACRAPHSPQNFIPSPISAPHAVQKRFLFSVFSGSLVPHSPQNFVPSGLTAPHSGQVRAASSASLAARASASAFSFASFSACICVICSSISAQLAASASS